MLTSLFFGCVLAGCHSSGDLLAGRQPFEVLRDVSDSKTRLAAYERLGWTAGDATASAEQRQAAIKMLGDGLANEKSPIARCRCAKALADFPEAEAIAALRQASADHESIVRGDVCKALSRHPDAATLDLLARVAKKDANQDVRLAAAKSLVACGASAETAKDMQLADLDDRLVELVRDHDLSIAKTAEDGLRMLHRDAREAAGLEGYAAWNAFVKTGKAPSGNPNQPSQQAQIARQIPDGTIRR